MFISSGFAPSGEAPDDAEIPALALPPQSIEYHLVHDRLSMLERLAALREGGTVTAKEFAAEKERILALPSEELILRPEMQAVNAANPSLLGRMFGWKLVLLGVVIGLGLAIFTRPDTLLGPLQRIF